LKAFALMVVAIILIIILAPFAFIMQAVRLLIMGKPIRSLFWNVAIGLDQLGGSILYLEPDWTVSSRTYWLRVKGNKYALYFEKFINVFFGKGHCEISYINEFNKGLIK